MSNKLYPWQQNDWQKLQSYITQNRVPQALLINGASGIGKQHLAERFAHALLCEHPTTDGFSCGKCSRCLLVKANTHPDFMMVKPEEDPKTKKLKTTIGIDQIRTLIEKLSLKPQFERYRVILIYPADTLNNAAANAFLKYLEEPTERTVLLLITHRMNKLPATIKSRCQKFTMEMPDKNLVLQWLSLQTNNAEVVFNLAQGSPLLAQQYASDEHLTQRRECFEAWLSIAKQQSHPVMVAEQWLKLPETTLLFWLSSWVIDLMRYRHQPAPKNLYHADLSVALSELAPCVNPIKLYEFYDLLLQSRRRLETQINKQVLWEEILIAWALLNRS
jgi:DNA polymerase-3 subunit delta'